MMTLSIVPADPALVELIGALNSIGSGVGLRSTERALGSLSIAVARSWQNSVGPEYKIERKKVSPFSYRISSKEKMVHWLEYGLPSYDMRMTHPFGKKGRVVKPRMKNGKPVRSWEATRKDGSKYRVSAGDEYLIIPFRKNTKGGKAPQGQKTLEDVYPEIKKQMAEADFSRTTVTMSAGDEHNTKVAPNAMGEQIKRAQYSWGTKFNFPDTPEYESLQGLGAMGSSKQSSLMNFRVVSVNSANGSWLHPGIKAKHYLQGIVERGQDKMQEIIESAIKRDLRV